MTPTDIITCVRRLIQDETATYRYSDAFLLDLVNQALKRMCLLRPDLFAYVGTVACTAGTVVQSAPSDSVRIIEVYAVTGGDGIVEANRETLDQSLPTWVNDTAAATINWMRNLRNPNKFFIYPKAPADQTLDIEYAQSPPDYAADATIALIADVYLPVLVDIVVFLAESIDNEHVNNGRAKMYQENFQQALGVATQSRSITDNEKAGMTDEETL